MLDIRRIREQFPITRQRFQVLGQAEPKPLIYMDHGASTHPPTPVLDTYKDFLEHSYANVHRGRHYLSEMATDRFEHVSDDIFRFIHGSRSGNTVILCGNTTQALDLAAHVMAHREGVTLVSLMEHHSNDLPHRARGQVVHFGVKDDGTLDYDDLEAKLREHEVKLVAVTGASNVTGYLPDIHRIARMAHARGAKVLIDGAQILAHAPIDVLPDDDPGHIDFFAGAGHKAYAPFGSSFLFGPTDLLDEAPPYIPAGRHGRLRHRGRGVLQEVARPARGRHAEHRRRGGARRGPPLPRGGGDGGGARARAGPRRAGDGRPAEARRRDGCSATPTPRSASARSSLTIDGVPHELAASILNREAAIAVRNGCFCAHPYLHRLLGLTDTTELRDRLVAGRGGGPARRRPPELRHLQRRGRGGRAAPDAPRHPRPRLEGRVRRDPGRRRLQGAVTRSATARPRDVGEALRRASPPARRRCEGRTRRCPSAGS